MIATTIDTPLKPAATNEELLYGQWDNLDEDYTSFVMPERFASLRELDLTMRINDFIWSGAY